MGLLGFSLDREDTLAIVGLNFSLTGLGEEVAVARIPEAEIERLKEQVSLVSLAEAAGVALRRTGEDLTGCCPFHEDDRRRW